MITTLRAWQFWYRASYIDTVLCIQTCIPAILLMLNFGNEQSSILPTTFLQAIANMKRLLILIAATLFLAGCKTVPIQDRDPIRVPSGLKENHVEAAILVTLGNHTANESSLSSWQMIADNALQSRLRGYRSAERTGYERYWYFEERKPGVVFVGFRKSELYMRVALHFDSNSVKMEIVESKNFRQSATEIHKNAYMYLDDFEYRLHRSLGDIARMVSYDTPSVESPKSPSVPKSQTR